MPVTNLKADWIGGNLVLTDDAGTAILTFNGTSKTITLGSTSVLAGGIFAALAAIPDADPEVSGQIWNDAGTLKASAGA